VIAALGWDVLDPDEVHREYRRRPADNPVDYALLLSRTPRLFIEAKGLGENIDDPKWANQTISYAAVAGVEWVALTDGAEWRLYNAHAPVPVEQKLFRAVGVTDDAEAAFELLTLLSKDNLRDNRIQELWRGFFVDRQMKTALAELFNAGEPARDLVALVAKRVPNLPKADIRASLVRARAAFDFPTPSLPTTPMPPAVSALPAAPATTPEPTGATQQARASWWTPVSETSGASRCRTSWRAGGCRRGLGSKPITGANTMSPSCLPTAGFDWRARCMDRCPAPARRSSKPSSALRSPSQCVRRTGAVWRATDAKAGDTTNLRVIRQRVAAERAT
jgi:hypothetical protein